MSIHKIYALFLLKKIQNEMKTIKFLFVGMAFLLCHVVPSTNSARILGFFTTPGRSHFIIYESLMKELAARGHDVSTCYEHNLQLTLLSMPLFV